MRFDRFVLGVLFVWRTTHLLNAEDGPWDAVVHLRRAAGDGFWGQMLDCFYCLSLWVSAPLGIFLGKRLGERILLWPALSAGAILLERMTDSGHDKPLISLAKESEDKHVLLWREESSIH